MHFFTFLASGLVTASLVNGRPAHGVPTHVGPQQRLVDNQEEKKPISFGIRLSDANGKGEVNLTTYFDNLPPNKTFRVDFETWSEDAWTWEALSHAPDSGNGTRAFKEGKSARSDKGVQASIDFVAKDNWIFFDIVVRTKNASAAVYASQFSPFMVE